MKKGLLVVLIALVSLSAVVFAAQFHSVPLGHEAYRMIDVAVLRGAIPAQTDVRPYNVNYVKSLLVKILSSDCFSASEKDDVNRVLESLDEAYGKSTTSEFTDLFKKGFLRTDSPSTMSIGGNASFDFTVGRGSDDENVFDARFGAMAYIRGDMFDFMSYDLNFKLNLDRIDTRATIIPDLKIECDGFYMQLRNGGARLHNLPDDGLYLGIEQFSEISFSFKDDMFSARIGTIKRDWGPGFNNLAISGSARAFDGFEMSFKPVPWFSYSVVVGSLGLFSLTSVNGVDWPSDNGSWHFGGMYNNNISSHRVELGPFGNMQFGAGHPLEVKIGIWESVIWRKRFELAYLNPFTIYMFAQNGLGDYDNVLAGLDFSFMIQGIGQFYGALAMDEMNNAHLITCPRDIMAYQVGAKFAPRFLDFTEITLQATYVTAFFGSHYSDPNSLFDKPYDISYVNKGQNIGYPVNPDTIELLANFRTSLGKGWTVDLTFKDQMRSAQYSYKTTGTDVLTTMAYSEYGDGEGGDFGAYFKRDFFKNLWNVTLCVDAQIEKQLESFPVSFYAGAYGILDRTRDFTPDVRHSEFDDLYFNPGRILEFGDWVNTFTLSAKFGAKIYY